MFQQKLIDLSHDLRAQPTADAMMAAVARELRAFGVEHFTFGGSTSAALGPQAVNLGINLYHSTVPAHRIAVVGGANRFGDDFSVRRMLQAGLDTVWTDPRAWEQAVPRELAHFSRINDLGFRRGYTGGLSRDPGYHTGIGLNMDLLTQGEFDRHWGDFQPKVMAIAALMDQVFRAQHIRAHFSLTPRERDVLSWLAMGLRPDQIADRLDVGYRTVDKYVVSAKAKLSAKTRDHAVARALMLGLLDI